MSVAVEDVGSFPLPNGLERSEFERTYLAARRSLIDKRVPEKENECVAAFSRLITDSMRRKLLCGLDVVTYPQHYDMYRQFLEPIHEAMDGGTYVVDEGKAMLPELRVLAAGAKELSEEVGSSSAINLRVCITGAMDLYLKEVGTTGYEDVLLMFGETVRRFARNAVLNTRWLRTSVVSIDEPSFGFQEVATARDVLLRVLERTFDFNGVTKEVHLHSSSRIGDMLEVSGVDVVSFEYAASPRNIESVSRRMLDKSDKHIRVGIARTDIDSIVAELLEKGIAKPGADQLTDSEDAIRKRFLDARRKYGDRMAFTGPDCGLGGWPSQEAAESVLRRTVNAVKSAKCSI